MNPKILDQILSTRENGSSLASTIATDGNGLNYYTKRLECLHDSSQTFKLVEPHIARLPRTLPWGRSPGDTLNEMQIEVCHRALQDLDPVFNISLPCQNSLSRPLFISFRKRNFKFFHLALGFYIGFLANTILKICNIVYTINQYITVPDPDLEMRGEGRSSRPLDKGEAVSNKNVSVIRTSVWSKNKLGDGPLEPLPQIRHCIVNILYIINVFYVVYGKIK